MMWLPLLEDFFFYVVMFFVTLGIVITLHEFGHYLAARCCNVAVEQFAFGFGKEFFGRDDQNGTRWSVCVFPIGGFVKLFGDVDPAKPIVWDHENECERRLSDEELKVAFCSKTVWQRMFIVSAGPVINLLLTLFIFVSVFTIYGQSSRPLQINAMAVDAPAYQAGIRLGDLILEMDGKPVRRLEDIYDFTKHESPAREHQYIFLRDGEVNEVAFTAKEISYLDDKGVSRSHGQTGMLNLSFVKFKNVYFVNDINTDDSPELVRSAIKENLGTEVRIGLSFEQKYNGTREVEEFITVLPVSLNTHLDDPDDEFYDRAFIRDHEDIYYVRLGLFEAVSRSLWSMKTIVVDSYKIVKATFQGRNDEQILAGVGKISEKTGKAAENGLYSYLMFLAGFSFMIAFVNLLPIPVLDGGYIIFLTYEATTGNPVSPWIQSLALIIGMVILGGIMVFANVSDLISLLGSAKTE